MPYVTTDEIELFYEEEGAGEPVVLVHGSWGDHSDWEGVAPLLAERFLVGRHDRRGYGRSGRPMGGRSRRQDEDDLAGLIGALDRGPAHVVGNSFGASVALGLARRRPELLRSLCVHEPPLLGAASHDARLRPLLDEVRGRIGAVVAQLRSGDHAGGARRFVEEIALGPGAWEALPDEVRQLVVANAPGFLGDVEDPGWADLPLDGRSRPGYPVLVTWGSESPAWLREVAVLVAGQLAGACARTLVGCGHLPHETHPAQYAAVVGGFIEEARPVIGARRDN
jgi:pimeloyl-ACP methyl ester carboxylesterase